MTRRRRPIACLLLLTTLVLPAQAAELERSVDIRLAWSAYEGLAGVLNVRGDLADARTALERADYPLDTLDFAAANEAVEAVYAARVKEEAAAALDQWTSAVAPIRAALLTIVPAFSVYDVPNDDGFALELAWLPVEDATAYRIERQRLDTDIDADVELVANLSGETLKFVNDKQIKHGREYEYTLTAMFDDADPRVIATVGPVSPQQNWLHQEKLYFFLFMAVICGAVVYFIERVRSGAELNVRKIAGLEAVDEAVGRATEMGRPIMFVPGILDINDIQTIAGLIVLGRVAGTAADHDAMLEVPTRSPLVMTAARETVQTSYVNAGRPDAYDEKKIYFTSEEQFAYVAAITGTMVREKPAASFYMGAFFAESLILAETANSVGSIQIAGTAMPAQLPFFVAACDYTLIGEEFFAASAYLSGEPHQLGSLKGQDLGKVICVILIVFGVFVASILALAPSLQNSLVGDTLRFLLNNVLTTTSG